MCTVLFCYFTLFWFWICSVSPVPQVINGGGSLQWVLCRELDKWKAIITFIVIFWGNHLVESGNDIVFTRNNKSVWRNTSLWVKRDVTLLDLNVWMLYLRSFLSLAAVESYFSFEMCLNLCSGFYSRRSGKSYSWD